MEAVYGLLGVDRGVPEVWGSVYDVRALLDSSVCLMDGRSPLDLLPGVYASRSFAPRRAMSSAKSCAITA